MENIRKTKGRRKVEMKKLEDPGALYVCFSKRRSGIFKKASDLSTLCGAEMLILIDSPAGRTHSFSHPSVNVLAQRFLGDLNSASGSTWSGLESLDPNYGLFELQRNANIQHLTRSCELWAELHDNQLKKKKALTERCQMLSAAPHGAILRSPDELKKLSLEELYQLAEQLRDFKTKLSARIDHIKREAETNRASTVDSNQGVNTFNNGQIMLRSDPSILPSSIDSNSISLNATPVSAGQTFSAIPTLSVNPHDQRQTSNATPDYLPTSLFCKHEIHNMNNPSFDGFNNLGDQNL